MRLLGDTEPLNEIKVRENSRQVQTIGPITVSSELLADRTGHCHAGADALADRV